MFRFKDYHIILVPRDKSSTRTFKITGFSLKALAVTACLAVPILLMSVLSTIYYQNKLFALKNRSFQNEELLASKTELVTKLATLEKSVEHLEESLGSLGQLLDVDPQSLSTGVGPALEWDGSSSMQYALNTVDIDTLVDQWFDESGNVSLARFNHKVEDLRQQTFDMNDVIREMANENKDRIKYAGSIPRAMPVEGWMTSEFGMRKHPIHHVGQMHYGLDLAAPYGSKIVAPADGMVAFSGYSSGYGKTLMIDHGYGVMTLYGHNSELTVKQGDRVIKGQKIAEVGSTGASTGPHLHYEVQVDGIPVNPQDWIVTN